ncbi:alpha/beta hydrolase [Streptomyces sp. NBRC 110028]|uniref:alpha/beta hydrolase n=1 Tax=Streptomyces sp. NBRC 110028 TaxID=1621260 RepID=UPI0006E1A940|nr:alpha/beta hydrolase [Streptomyces sp. NBRC 110028]
MDYATLTSLKPSEFEDAADGYQSVSNMADHARETVERRIAGKMQAALEGEAASAALTQLRKLGQNFHYIQVECGLVSTALNAMASDFREAKNKLDSAVADAQEQKLTVNADGSVSYPAGGEKGEDGKTPEGGKVSGIAKASSKGPLPDAGDSSDTARSIARQAANLDPNPNHARALECADRIAQAIQEAAEADELWAPKLRSLRADDDLTVSDDDWIDTKKDTGGVRSGAKDYLDAIKDRPKNGDPQLTARWWKGLSKDQQEALIALDPAGLGKTDGLPAEVRDEANRTVLSEARAQYRTERDAIPPEPTKFRSLGPNVEAYTDEWLAWHHKYENRAKQLDKALAGMDNIEKRFERTGTKNLPEAYLLGFDPFANTDGRVIIANGNPDTADHTATYVPGSKTDQTNIEDELDKSETLWRESSSRSANESVSTITWFDYNAPRSVKPMIEHDVLPEAMSDKYAAEGAPRLRQFLDGNAAAHEAATGEKGHSTLMGHSYGTTVIGDAAKVDPPYHGDRTHDPLPVDDVMTVASPGVQAKSPGDMGIDPQHFWAMASPDDTVPGWGKSAGLGEDRIVPSDSEFGANIMTTDTEGHSGYWDYKDNEASDSLKNQANVIVGRYGDVKLKQEAHE